jgi:signal transduction histidine kinase
MREAQRILTLLEEFLERVEVAQSRHRVLREEMSQMRSQLEAGAEAMGLGLTAEALSHEMFTIADGLATRTQAIVSALDEGKMTGEKVRRFVQYVRGSVAALRKELAHFSPSMRYVREKREEINIRDFAAEIAEYYQHRWEREKIQVTVVDESKGAPFMVRAGRGRLTQVLDNLLLNSGYWVGVAQRQKMVTRGEVTVRIQSPRLIISDNGPGVEPSVESSLFEAFVTRKPRGTGRGLGLFIVRQLLESQDCTIELGPKRDKKGRRHEFVVNLSGMADVG